MSESNTAPLDPSTLTVEELSKLVGEQRSIRIRRDLDSLRAAKKTITEVPRAGPVETAVHVTNSRQPQWCKVADDGYTPRRKHPTMAIDTMYDSAVGVPTRRTWTFLDQFSPVDRVTDHFTVEYPCLDPETVARDITRAWQVYQTKDLKPLDYILLANTPLSINVDGANATRYGDLWMHKKIHGGVHVSTKWRACRGHITS